MSEKPQRLTVPAQSPIRVHQAESLATCSSQTQSVTDVLTHADQIPPLVFSSALRLWGSTPYRRWTLDSGPWT